MNKRRFKIGKEIEIFRPKNGVAFDYKHYVKKGEYKAVIYSDTMLYKTRDYVITPKGLENIFKARRLERILDK